MLQECFSASHNSLPGGGDQMFEMGRVDLDGIRQGTISTWCRAFQAEFVGVKFGANKLLEKKMNHVSVCTFRMH